MRISLSNLPSDSPFADVTVRSRVTVELVIEVENIESFGDGITVSGDLREIDVKNVRGVGGTDPIVESALDGLRSGKMLVRTMGTMG